MISWGTKVPDGVGRSGGRLSRLSGARVTVAMSKAYASGTLVPHDII